MIRAKLRAIEANDIRDWPSWSPSGPADEVQWFTVSVGSLGGRGADLFQVAVATPMGLHERRDKRRFVGLVIERLEPPMVEGAIRAFVEDCEAPDWDGVVARLRQRMQWEYEGRKHRGTS